MSGDDVVLILVTVAGIVVGGVALAAVFYGWFLYCLRRENRRSS